MTRQTAKSAAFSWDEKGKALLRSLTCQCGEDVVEDVEDMVRFDGDDDETVTCNACGREYEAHFLIKLAETSGPSGEESTSSSEDELGISSATGLILEGEDKRIQLYYESSISGNSKEVVGTVTDTERGLWALLEAENNDVADEDDEIKVFGSEVSDRDKGEVTKNGRKVGTFENAESI